VFEEKVARHRGGEVMEFGIVVEAVFHLFERN